MPPGRAILPKNHFLSYFSRCWANICLRGGSQHQITARDPIPASDWRNCNFLPVLPVKTRNRNRPNGPKWAKMSQKITFWAISAVVGPICASGVVHNTKSRQDIQFRPRIGKIMIFTVFTGKKNVTVTGQMGQNEQKKTLFELFRPLLGKYLPQGWFTAPNHSKKSDFGLSLAKIWFLPVF